MGRRYTRRKGPPVENDCQGGGEGLILPSKIKSVTGKEKERSISPN